MKKKKNFLTLEEFGSAIGLNTLEKEMTWQKNRAIDYLKTSRIRKKISQSELAGRLGTQQPAIARMEAGFVGEVSFDFLVRVALALRVTLEIHPHAKAA